MSLVDLLRNVVVKDMTILAPLDSPNTDGIDPGTYLRNVESEFILELVGWIRFPRDRVEIFEVLVLRIV